jgi:hypothetical protein
LSSSDGYADGWYGDCVNTYAEESKQIRKAKAMGLPVSRQMYPYREPVIDMGGRSVLDLGGGPVSLLLKTVEAGRRAVLDPGEFPAWIRGRYQAAGIELIPSPAETFPGASASWDEVWIMNTLRHVDDPEKCVRVARRLATRIVRICEWVDEPLAGRVLTKRELDDWCGAEGDVTHWLREDAQVQAMYVVFAAPAS